MKAPRRRRTESDFQTEIAAIRELVDWARDGYDPAFVPGPRHGLYLLPTAYRASFAGWLQPWEHFLFLAALCERKDVALASHVVEDLSRAAARVELGEAAPEEGMEAYRRVFERLCAAPEMAYLRTRVPAQVAASRAQAAEAERQRMKSERRQLRARFEAAVREIAADARQHLPVVHTPAPLDLADLRLALAWTLGTDVAAASRAAPSVEEALERYGTHSGLRRNLSARAAEHAAAAMYGLLYPGEVRDVAGSGETDDWRTHDLLAGGRAVDVKNVRYWRRRGHPVEEARVAAFKTTRAGDSVAIAGMRSRMTNALVLFDLLPRNGERDVEYLGETNEVAFEALVGEFGDGPLDLDFSRPGSEGELFLPHWLFDFPCGVYTGRPHALARITPELFGDPWFWGDAALHPLPVALLAGMDITGAPAAGRLAPWQRDFFETLLRRRSLGVGADAGPSLPVLYLSVLEHFLTVAGSPKAPPAGFEPDGYRGVLFFDLTKAQRHWPGGVYDPRETLAGLIDALAVLWRKRADLAGLRQFRLSGNGILEGRPRAGDPWMTLVAYCGDCAFSPLVLGSHTPCPHCRKLVCRVCNFCSAPPRDLSRGAAGERSCQGGRRDAPRDRY